MPQPNTTPRPEHSARGAKLLALSRARTGLPGRCAGGVAAAQAAQARGDASTGAGVGRLQARCGATRARCGARQRCARAPGRRRSSCTDAGSARGRMGRCRGAGTGHTRGRRWRPSPPPRAARPRPARRCPAPPLRAAACAGSLPRRSAKGGRVRGRAPGVHCCGGAQHVQHPPASTLPGCATHCASCSAAAPALLSWLRQPANKAMLQAQHDQVLCTTTVPAVRTRWPNAEAGTAQADGYRTRLEAWAPAACQCALHHNHLPSLTPQPHPPGPHSCSCRRSPRTRAAAARVSAWPPRQPPGPP